MYINFVPEKCNCEDGSSVTTVQRRSARGDNGGFSLTHGVGQVNVFKYTMGLLEKLAAKK